LNSLCALYLVCSLQIELQLFFTEESRTTTSLPVVNDRVQGQDKIRHLSINYVDHDALWRTIGRDSHQACTQSVTQLSNCKYRKGHKANFNIVIINTYAKNQILDWSGNAIALQEGGRVGKSSARFSAKIQVMWRSSNRVVNAARKSLQKSQFQCANAQSHFETIFEWHGCHQQDYLLSGLHFVSIWLAIKHNFLW